MRKKSSILFLAVLIIVCVACLCACNGEGNQSVAYTVTFDVDGASYHQISTSGSEQIQLPSEPIKSDLVFDGWYRDKDTWSSFFTASSLLNQNLTENITVYARWITQDEATKPRVVFETNGGKTLSSGRYDVINVSPNTSKSNHTFGGWYTEATFTEGSKVVFPLQITSNVTLYAKWVPYDTELNSRGNLTIKSYTGNEEQVEIPSSVNGVVVDEIGTRAFTNFNGLTSVIIPDSVTIIGARAFNWLPELRSVTIGNGVTSIGEEAFFGCGRLTSITIPDSVTSIGEGAFFGCDKLTNLTIGNSVVSIGEDAFNQCRALTSITIPNSVTSIGDAAFYDCSGLTSITIPDSVTSIGMNTFNACSGLTSITIPNSVTSIGNYAFYECSALTSITISDSVTSIGSNVFGFCSNLATINCAAEKQPADWNSDWNINCNATVEWGYKG